MTITIYDVMNARWEMDGLDTIARFLNAIYHGWTMEDYKFGTIWGHALLEASSCLHHIEEDSGILVNFTMEVC